MPGQGNWASYHKMTKTRANVLAGIVERAIKNSSYSNCGDLAQNIESDINVDAIIFVVDSKAVGVGSYSGLDAPWISGNYKGYFVTIYLIESSSDSD